MVNRSRSATTTTVIFREMGARMSEEKASETRRIWIFGAAFVVVILGTPFGVWYYSFRICEVRLVACADEDPDWVYFPVVVRGTQLCLPTSYQEQIDFPAYNANTVTPDDPLCLNVTWCFRRSMTVDKCGLVFQLWPTKGKIDNSSARVLWFSQNELKRAILDGVIRLPRIQELPRFPQNDLASLVKATSL